MAISKERKAQLVEEYTQQLRKSKGIILADYLGLTMANLTSIRRTLRPIGASSHVVKNNLMALALAEVGMSVPDEWLTGPTAVGFCFDEVPAVARALRDATRQYEKLRIKGGLVGSSVLTAEEVMAIADLPSREALLAQVLGAISAPAGQIAGVVVSGIRQVLGVVQAYIDKLGEAEGGATGTLERAAEAV